MLSSGDVVTIGQNGPAQARDLEARSFPAILGSKRRYHVDE